MIVCFHDCMCVWMLVSCFWCWFCECCCWLLWLVLLPLLFCGAGNVSFASCRYAWLSLLFMLLTWLLFVDSTVVGNVLGFF